ncbi:MAG: OFA family MFS transporter [Deltaproteobacteria bacterium]|nr:OFA family MFS transporter [Deltaproteobacteria bacterium]
MSVLDRERTVAPAGYSRWLVPPAALAVHLSIGQAYALSVFNLPLTRIVGIDHSAPSDWSLSATIWMFNIAFFFLGASAAVFGTWVERSGPRKAMLASALCFSGGFFVAALGVELHQLVLLYAGYGVLGGIGLGLGYISPVSTLLKWFPDRPGMATGLAIMGFGGGAMVGAPLGVALMDRFRSATSAGVAETFLAMGGIYLVIMSFGAVTVRVPPAAVAATTTSGAPAPASGTTARDAIRTGAFWCVWIVLFTNVTAGIGVLGQASPMIQEMFAMSPHAAAGFVGLLSLFNLVGRFVWSSLSDRLGRKKTYAVYLGLGMLLYALVPTTKTLGAAGLFVACTCVILSMYGGGFSTVPAYLRDLFGTREVGAIHGRLLTAWSTAALVGPSLVTYVREAQVARGVAKSEAYSITMYGLVALLAVGFVANLRVRIPAAERAGAATRVAAAPERELAARPPIARLALYWAVAVIPLAWGVVQVVKKSAALFVR